MSDEAEFDEFAEGAEEEAGAAARGRNRALVRALRQQKASWQQDGKGIRGDVEIISNTAANLNWPDSGVFRRTNPEMDQGSTDVDAEVPTDEES